MYRLKTTYDLLCKRFNVGKAGRRQLIRRFQATVQQLLREQTQLLKAKAEDCRSFNIRVFKLEKKRSIFAISQIILKMLRSNLFKSYMFISYSDLKVYFFFWQFQTFIITKFLYIYIFICVLFIHLIRLFLLRSVLTK